MTEEQRRARKPDEELPTWARGNNDRGGPHFGELIDRVRDVMDASRYVLPSDELARELIDDLGKIVARMEEVAVPVEQAPADTRKDLPSRGNPSLPPIDVTALGPEGVEAEATFRDFHLGRNAAHGGNVSLLFDELAGYATMQRVTNGWPRTAFLKVNFRSLTPVGRTVRARVWVDRVEGRKLWVLGTLHDGDTLCADAEGLFIEVPIDQYAPTDASAP